MILFSVIIPVFNREGLIRVTLESVFKQTCDSFEVIVVDDGSTDGTLEILSEYSDRIKVFQQENKGPGEARNLGIRNAEGQYIVFLDSDDLWFPWTLSTYKQVIATHDFPSFIAGAPTQFHTEVEIHSIQPEPLSIQIFSDYFASSKQPLWIQPGAVAIRADVLKAVGGFTELWINGEDCDLWAKLGTAEKFIHIQHPTIYAYRQHENSAIASSHKTYQGMFYLIQQEESGQYPGACKRKQERLEILTRHIRPVSLKSIHEYKVKVGWELYLKTFRWHLRLRRIRYLVAFPIMAILTLILGFFKAREIPQQS